MVSSFSTVFLLGASILSSSNVNAQKTTSPPAAAPSATPGAGDGPLPLTAYHFTYPNLPEQVNPFPVGRGPQTGYNVCNKTTEGPDSMCQTMFVNSIDDFCLWGAEKPNSLIGDIEARVVAYCTKPGHGTRLIPPGTLTAVQFIKTTGYIQVTGLFNQSGIGIQEKDAGGELDPHGADLAGNPLGGLVFSNNLPSSKDNSKILQVPNWTNFIGGDQFCIKACDPTVTSPNYCENKFDTQGCAFNMPASYAPNEFTSCKGENQAPPGGAPVIPASSECTTFTSSILFPNTATSTTAATTTGGASGSGSTAKSSSTAKSGATSIITALPGAAFFAVISSIVIASLAGVVVVA